MHKEGKVSVVPGQRPGEGFTEIPGGIGGHRGGGARWLQGGEKPKNAKRTLSRLAGYFKGEARTIAGVFALVTANGALALTAPRLIGLAVDAMGNPRAGAPFSPILLVLISVYLAEAVAALGQAWFMAGASQRIVSALRRIVFGKLQRLPVAFFDGRSHGDLMSRLSNDVDNISSSLSQSTIQLMGTAIAVSGSLVIMLLMSPILTLASLITVPLVFALTRTVSRRTRVLFKDQQKALGGLNGHIEEMISGIKEVKAFNREGRTFEEFVRLNEVLRGFGTRALIWSGYIMPLMNVINNLGFVAIALTGGILAARGHASVGTIASFIAYSRQFARPLNELANVYTTLQTAMAGAERVFEIMDEGEEASDPPSCARLGRPDGLVELRKVGFSYRPDTMVLRDLSFSAAPGSVTALVGPTGAGKTTIVNLIARFYDPTEGVVAIDGRDLREYARSDVRRCFGIVLQDSYLFSGTIRENILYGRPEASEEDMVRAAAAASADRFIRRLPQGYDTPLSESGSSLSQGQRQLLTIARVLLTDPSILILDEATSNVDTRTELRIQEAMIALMRGRTSFIIAHRLSTIRGADRILVIDSGRILEEGNHETLMAAGGLYSRLYESQS